MSFWITGMTEADIARCVQLERELFPRDDPWSAVAFRSELANPHTHYFTAHADDGKVLGYAGIALLGAPVEPESEVHTIGVDSRAHRLGIGTALLTALLDV
ncbi:MAG: GNAT family N-acetyltransferase, partial [Aldersonia sp.]|nr:GNAT family N-acetyltransferase [Aldersonia sp.]